MCFGNDSPPSPPQLPPPPPPPEMMDVIDEVSGVQSIVAKGPDGKPRRMITRLPRTPEEEAFFKEIDDLIGSSMRNIQQLYKYDPASAVDYSPLINTFANIDRKRMESLAQIANIGNIEEDIANFKAMQSALLDERFELDQRNNEERLAHSGRGAGTYAAESRAALARAHNLARMEGDVRAANYGEDLAAKRLARNKEAFNLEEMGRQGQLQSASGQYALAKEHEADMERRRQRAIEENRGLMQVGMGLKGADESKALGSNATATSLATFNAEAADSMNRYNADVNRIQANYNMAMADYNAQPPSFGEVLGRGLGMGAMHMFTASGDSMAGRLGKKLVG